MPIEDLLRYLLPRAPSIIALVVVMSLPLAAAVLLSPPRRRTAPALLSGGGLLLGSIALIATPGLRGPLLYDPAVLAARRLVGTVAGSVFIAGTLCLLAAVVLILIRPRNGRPRGVLGPVAGLLIGLGAPFAFRASLGRQLWSMEFHGGVLAPVVTGLLMVAALFALLVYTGSRVAAVAVGIGAGAIPAAVLTATVGGMHVLAMHSGTQLFLAPTFLAPAASLCVGLLGAAVWMMAGNYWSRPETVNPAGDRPASSSRSS